MSRRLVAQYDPSLRATITRVHELRYSAGPDPQADRPEHVRAGSSLTLFQGRLAVIQDDANFIALFDPASLDVTAVALPRGAQGLRQFDDARGNKPLKLDLEACTTVRSNDGDRLLAFGSGSTPEREWIGLLNESSILEMELTALPNFYRSLRAATEFSGSELNLEGAIHFNGEVRLFNRGNGAAREGLEPVNATADLSWSELLAHIESPTKAHVPSLKRITQYELGELDGVRLTFTDATQYHEVTLYVATAESSPDAVRDGPVAGSALGVIRGDRVRWGRLLDHAGQPLAAKVEGVCWDPDRPRQLFILVDRDDPELAAELCEVALGDAF